MAGLIGAYPPVDLPESARPAARLDARTLGDVTAQRDAAIGWLAQRHAQDVVAAAQADDPPRSFRSCEIREIEDQASAEIWERITTAHDIDDVVDSWRLIAVRNERPDGAP